MDGGADRDFVRLAGDYLDDRAERHPDLATGLGDHRFDDRLPDLSAAALADELRALDRWAAALDALDAGPLSAERQVDAAIMADSVARRIFELDELREHTWNPLPANPGKAIYMLLARDFAPLPDRLASVAARLAEIPRTLAEARAQLGPTPRVHLETAIGQFDGTIALVSKEIDAALEDAPASAARIGQVRPAALEALAGHRAWLGARLDEAAPGPDGDRDPRIGPERFARKLSLNLSAAADADAILARAQAELDLVSEQIAELAAELAGPGAQAGPEVVRRVLDRLAEDVPDEATILDFCRDALTAQTAFVTDRRLVSVFDDPVEVIAMPEIDRGVAVAYCDSPGPLESAPLPTFIAVSPAPAAGRRSASPRSTASTTGTWCTTWSSTRRCPDTTCSCSIPAGSRVRAPPCGPRSGRARSSRGGPSTPSGSWPNRATRATAIPGPSACSSSRCSCGRSSTPSSTRASTGTA